MTTDAKLLRLTVFTGALVSFGCWDGLGVGLPGIGGGYGPGPTGSRIASPGIGSPDSVRVITQGPPHSGLPDEAAFTASFDWTAVAGAVEYEVVAYRFGPFSVAFTVRSPGLSAEFDSKYIMPDSLLDGWEWRVRAIARDGGQSSWSAPGRMTFEPCLDEGDGRCEGDPWPLSPRLVAPDPDVAVPQNDTTLSQPPGADPERGHGYRVPFEWEPYPGADSYLLTIRRRGSAAPAVVTRVTGSSWVWTSIQGVVIDSNLENWEWRLEPRLVWGGRAQPSDWSSFSFAPCRLKDGASCR